MPRGPYLGRAAARRRCLQPRPDARRALDERVDLRQAVLADRTQSVGHGLFP